MPMFGLIFSRLAMSAISRSSFSFSTTIYIRLPIFWASRASSMYFWSLYPLHIMSAFSAMLVASTACSSGFEPASSPMSNRLP